MLQIWNFAAVFLITCVKIYERFEMCDIDTCDKSETATTREQILGVAKLCECSEEYVTI